MHRMIPGAQQRMWAGWACAAICGAALAVASPLGLALALGALCLAACVHAALHAPAAAAALWLFAVAATPDMWLEDLAPGAAEPAIALLKLSGLGLAAICVRRFGGRADWFNPGLPFLAMFAASLVHGRMPGLSMTESVRSLVGSMAPFALSFSVLRRDWCETVLRAVRWLPLGAVAAGAALHAAGLHELVVDAGGARLAGAGHPAFLAGFALAGLYACLLEALRSGRAADLALLGVNLLILVLTGARAPLAVGFGVVVLSLLFAPSPGLPWRLRLPVLLAGGLGLCVLLPLAAQLSSLRLFGVLESDARDLSGRAEIWPLFEQARDASPWVGWGVGAGKAVVPPDGELARLLGTTAAHNEYLRIGVEGGWLGLGLLVAAFVFWTWRHTRGVRASDRVALRLMLAGSAVHAYTDNTLIATTAVVMFAFVSAAFARARLEAPHLQDEDRR